MNEASIWDKKYKDRENKLKIPEDFIVQNANILNRGLTLDFASGDGRNSIYLAKKGFQMVAADFSEEALKRLNIFSSDENVSIKTHLIDLTDKEKLLSLGKFENIIICCYKVEDHLIKVLEDMLNPSGLLVYCTFNVNHHIKNGFKKELCLDINELSSKFSLELIKYESLNIDNRYLDGYIFRK